MRYYRLRADRMRQSFGLFCLHAATLPAARADCRVRREDLSHINRAVLTKRLTQTRLNGWTTYFIYLMTPHPNLNPNPIPNPNWYTKYQGIILFNYLFLSENAHWECSLRTLTAVVTAHSDCSQCSQWSQNKAEVRNFGSKVRYIFDTMIWLTHTVCETKMTPSYMGWLGLTRRGLWFGLGLRVAL